jgi:ABC-type lipoprotein release transport system permease subunit
LIDIVHAGDVRRAVTHDEVRVAAVKVTDNFARGFQFRDIANQLRHTAQWQHWLQVDGNNHRSIRVSVIIIIFIVIVVIIIIIVIVVDMSNTSL